MEEGVRIDKWLWAVRIFKTRSQATLACKSGKVRILSSTVKPSRDVHSGEVITISLPPITRTVKVTVPIENRVSAKLAVDFVEELTPKEEFDKLHNRNEKHFEYRQRGIGRPTKKERRDIDILKKYLGL